MLAQMGEERTLRAESRFARSRNLVRSPIFECSCLQYRFEGKLRTLVSAAVKIGTATQPEAAPAWAAAALACMGVVFGDIGTSPLYTLNVAAKAASPRDSCRQRLCLASCR